MPHDFDFSKLTIPIDQWAMCWAQCMSNGATRELWVGTETQSCLVGHAEGSEDTCAALSELVNMIEAAKPLKGTR